MKTKSILWTLLWLLPSFRRVIRTVISSLATGQCPVLDLQLFSQIKVSNLYAPLISLESQVLLCLVNCKRCVLLVCRQLEACAIQCLVYKHQRCLNTSRTCRDMSIIYMCIYKMTDSLCCNPAQIVLSILCNTRTVLSILCNTRPAIRRPNVSL